jgi:Ca2+-binding RTX toxin-like protein
VALGSGADQVVVVGTSGNDTIAAGLNGVSLNADGDVDVTFSVLPAALEIQGLDGVNFLTGRGGFGAGLAYAGSLTLRAGNLGDELNGGNGNDLLVGGNGNDVITGNAGADQIAGGAGADTLSGSDGNDSIVGGPGADSLVGGFDDDTLDAFDGEADTQIHGGPGVDTAYVDPGLDPATIAVENVVGAAPPPPAPPAPPAPAANTCVYHADQKAVAATVSPNGSGTLAVVSGQIRFGASHVPCGAATNANTDTIFVFGSAGAKERLVVNLTGGAFAPGATAEPAGSPEIEIVTSLGSATDEILVLGSVADEMLVAGSAGMAFNNDSDADLTYSSPPAYLELQGGGGRNVLTAQGGSGTGGAFAGRTTIMAGAVGDELHGGNGDDLLVGGAGSDTISGYAGADQLWGLGGNDLLNGGDGNDALIGGAGVDALSGGANDDLLDAVDVVADALIDGGAGNDTAYYDRLADPAPVAVEIHFPR